MRYGTTLKIISMKKDFLAFLKVHSHLRWRMLFLFFSCFANLHAQIITTIAGNGMSGYTGDGGAATAAKMRLVSAIAVANNGDMYVSDPISNVVRKVNTAGIISTFAGNDTAGFSGDGGPATIAKINYPDCITFDKKGNVYIADLLNFRVRMVDTNGIISTFAGNGPNPFSGDGGPATAAGLGGNLVGICIDNIGNIYITSDKRIRKIDTFGIISTFAGTGLGGFGGNGGPATAAALGAPAQIEMDVNGNMYIAEDSCIRKINTIGIITTIAGNGTVGFSGDGGPATAAALDAATGVFPDKCGNFYISDSYNNRIRKVEGNGIITTVAGNWFGSGGIGTGGYSGDGGPATAAELRTPSMIYLDSNSNVYIADGYNYCVRLIKMDSCRNTTDVPNVTNARNADIYPNPATDELTIKMSEGAYSSFVIFNSMGQAVLQKEVNTLETNVDIKMLPLGLYYIMLKGAQGKLVKKVVKM